MQSQSNQSTVSDSVTSVTQRPLWLRRLHEKNCRLAPSLSLWPACTGDWMEVTTDRQEDCSSASSHSATERLLSRDGRGAEAERQRGREAGRQGREGQRKARQRGQREKRKGSGRTLKTARRQTRQEEQGTHESTTLCSGEPSSYISYDGSEQMDQ